MEDLKITEKQKEAFEIVHADCKNVPVLQPRRKAGMMVRPETIEEWMVLAQIFANSALVPKDYQGRPENCFIAFGLGDSVGLDPFQSVQNIAVVKGRPCFYGDMVKALCLRDPNCEWIEEEPIQEIKKTGIARCTTKMKGHKPHSVEYSIDDAKKAGLWSDSKRWAGNADVPWVTNPYRMLQMRARGFDIRDANPGCLKGVGIAEEMYGLPERWPADMMPKSNGAESAPRANHRGAEFLIKIREKIKKKLNDLGIRAKQDFSVDSSLGRAADGQPASLSAPETQVVKSDPMMPRAVPQSKPAPRMMPLPPSPYVTKDQISYLMGICDIETLAEYVEKKFNILSLDRLKSEDYQTVENWILGI